MSLPPDSESTQVLAFLFRAGGSATPSMSAHQSSRSGMTPPWLQIT